MNSFHVNQLNKVLNYIDASLSDDLNLEKLASVGNYSAFHFHRLFSAYTGETLNSYINHCKIPN
ncbi:AraC family transcriptional regulator [Nubsella zeaxanthinifaciens]|uniref:AraC family transcriptional regulator n=1 Tax=Nubsella zeaxanthinifaciens TaxID=392412 RepID=UPI003D06C83D